MRRREFSTLLGGAATASTVWPSPLSAQKATAVIGYLGAGASGVFAARVAAFRQGLSETGYVEGQNLTIAGQRVSMIDCPHLPPTLLVARSM